jgi:tRNA modification GTPase
VLHDRGQLSIGTGRSDTIAAIATPPGWGAIAIVRMSGAEAIGIAERVTGTSLATRRAEFCAFRDAHGERIDAGIALAFRAPNSYTGEDLVEFQVHGGAVVADWLLETLLKLGARPATPGEFTLRAYLNDKLDLAQAEAVADLVASASRASAQAATRSLAGQFSRAVSDIQARLTETRAHLEAHLDFPDEPIEPATIAMLAEALCTTVEGLRALDRKARQGAVLRDGLSVAIAGAPNAGKSSLLNSLAGYDAAIVTEFPGTTRDPLRERLVLDSLPVEIVDTAGLRETSDIVEVEGLKRARSVMGAADHILWICDVREEPRLAIEAARAEISLAVPFTLVRNKVDLLGSGAECTEVAGVFCVSISALTGEGVGLLIARLKTLAGFSDETKGAFSARRHQLDALERAGLHVENAVGKLEPAPELAAEELRLSQAALSEVTGALTSDDLLGEIFGRFCIGK